MQWFLAAVAAAAAVAYWLIGPRGPDSEPAESPGEFLPELRDLADQGASAAMSVLGAAEVMQAREWFYKTMERSAGTPD